MSNPIKRNNLNLQQKLNLLDELKKGANRKELSTKYKCSLSVISRLVKGEQKLRNMAIKNVNIKRKRIRKSNYDKIDKAISKWFHEKRSQNAIISGPLICEQAQKFAQMLKVNDFKPSNGWLYRWKTKENVTFQKLQGEKTEADVESASDWLQSVLPTFLSQYNPDCIYNADETVLYYKALPRGTLATVGDKPPGGKVQKARLTLK